MLTEDKAREELQKILDDREYKIYEKEPGFLEKWWRSVEEWLAEQLEDLFPSIEPTPGIAGKTLMIVIIAIIVILLISLIWTLIKNNKRKERLRKTKPLQSNEEWNWTYQKHLDEASKQEAKHAYDLASRHLFLALLLYSHEKEWLKARIWKTNWEYYDELIKVNKEWAGQFFTLAQHFDSVTYGEHPVTAEEYEEYKKIVMKWFQQELENHVVPETNGL
ncbi:DUF4129 domain-containing protein [Metabacillus sp. HB246100]|uniref:DUF4129 domain-containing protein n=1 Tax=Bacillus weihaiensis TaxID=1547283 RepID=UPI0023579183|nr:DUF4129 domain-containing protein [Bacillus weihaiensis]